ncbi:hypothetical protein ACX281_08870 [Cetobacterium somerae]
MIYYINSTLINEGNNKMKININANHIRIYKLLNFIPDKNIDFICHFLRMNKQNVILYIKQIYQFTENKKQDILLQDMIKEILNNQSLFKILKQNQTFAKEDRIFYIILALLNHNDLTLNLNTLSSILNISRRTLSEDLISVKKSLKFYHLNIYSIPSKGVCISGDISDIKNCFLSYLFKFLVEFEELPLLMSDLYLSFFQQKVSEKTIHEIDYFLYAFDLDIFANNKKLLNSIYQVYLDENCYENISTLSLEDFKKNFSDVFSKKYIEKAYIFFKNSSLGNFPLKNINTFALTLKFCTGILKEKNTNLDKEYSELKKIFSRVIPLNSLQNNSIERFCNRIHIASKESSFLSLHDLSFLSLNLNDKIKNECYQLFLELRKIYPNVQLSNIIFIYLLNFNKNVFSEVTNTIVVFRDLPRFLHPIIKNLFLLKENIHISHFIKYYELDAYLLHEDVSLVITFENLTINSNYPFIKYYSLPI